MFVLMVAALPPILSDHPPDFPRRAGLGDRFHYFRGHSGRRYLFSRVALGDLAGFRSAVVIVARRVPGGRLAAHAMITLDRFGRPADSRRPCPPIVSVDSVILVHLLAASEADRRVLVDDLTAVTLPLAA